MIEPSRTTTRLRVTVAIATVIGLTSSALANPRAVVLQAEGAADGSLRTKVDASVLKLANASDAQIVPGDITFADAAAAVGCKPDVPACRNEVLGMLGVDEIVYTTVTPKDGGVVIQVFRVKRDSTRNAKMWLADGANTDRLDRIAPLFDAAAVASLPPVSADPPAVVGPPPSEPATTDPQPTEHATTDTAAADLFPPMGDPPALEPATTTGTTAAAMQFEPRDDGRNGRRLQIAGMIGGGGMVLVGFLLWGEAGTIQEQVDTHPTTTRMQIEDLAALERRGDSFAAWGNVLFLGGAIIGGVSTYYFVKSRKARTATQTARIAPAVFGGGAGVTLTIGGAR